MKQVLTFGLVGVLATLIHYTIALFCIERLFIAPLLANVIAYATAVTVSYLGHSALTFKKSRTKSNAVKFLTVSLLALALSQLVLHFLTIYTALGHRLIFMIVVFSIPALSFVLNKYWVYTDKH